MNCLFQTHRSGLPGSVHPSAPRRDGTFSATPGATHNEWVAHEVALRPGNIEILVLRRTCLGPSVVSKAKTEVLVSLYVNRRGPPSPALLRGTLLLISAHCEYGDLLDGIVAKAGWRIMVITDKAPCSTYDWMLPWDNDRGKLCQRIASDRPATVRA